MIFILAINVSEINRIMSLILHVLVLLYPSAWEDQRKPLVITKKHGKIRWAKLSRFSCFSKVP